MPGTPDLIAELTGLPWGEARLRLADTPHALAFTAPERPRQALETDPEAFRVVRVRREGGTLHITLAAPIVPREAL